LKKNKFILFFAVIAVASHPVFSQVFLNGSFENNTSSACNYNMSNATFTSLMANSTAYGVQSQLDIMNNTCPYGTPQSGLWMVSLATNAGTTDAFTTMLSAPLVAGNTYTMSFYDRGDPNYPPGVPIQIGISTVAGTGGTIVYTAPAPSNGPWSFRAFVFVAPNNGQHVSISTTGAPLWTFVDNFCLGPSCATVLPIELGDFKVECKDGLVQLNWSTFTERNNDYFTIEKSSDALNFTGIGTMKGAGNSNVKLNYGFSDVRSEDKTYYYRIKQTDFDQTFSYTQILSVETCKSSSDLQFNLYPNPANGQLNILANSKNASVMIVNPVGDVLYKGDLVSDQNAIDVSQFKNGIYFVELFADGKTQIKKFVKN
jgi:hypothetical protein